MYAHPQLPLALDTAPTVCFDSFHVDEQNRVARDAVCAFIDKRLDDSQMLLWGEDGVGKTHLLSAACDRMNSRGFRVAYIPGELVNIPGALEGLESCSLVCIDDLQRVDHSAEQDLFHCINRCRDADTLLLFASDRVPDKLGLRLMDLQTRLGWGPVFQVQGLEESGLQRALQNEIELRALQASDDVIAFILRRFPRRISLLKQLVDILDQASLSEQRRITVPLVKKVFGDAEQITASELGRLD